MSNIAGSHGSGTSSTSHGITHNNGVGGALSLMGCVREASPQPQDQDALGTGDYANRTSDTPPKEPKKRRFHPFRGLRKIFRRKPRADGRLQSTKGDESGIHDREEVTLSHPAGRSEEGRSRSASELLTDSNRPSVFLRRSADESLVKLRGASGQLSVSHDSIFPGEVSHTRPLSSLDSLATLQRRQPKASDHNGHRDDLSSQGAHNNRLSSQVLKQIKTAIEGRNQLTSAESTHASHNHPSKGKKRERINEEERFRAARTEQQDVVDRVALAPKEELPELESASLNHTAAHHRISVRPKNRRLPNRSTIPSCSVSCSTITTVSESSDGLDSLEQSLNNNANSPSDTKSVTILRKSSSRLSRTSDNIFEDHETHLTQNPSSVTSLSPDSLDLVVPRLISDTTSESEDNREKGEAKRALNRMSGESDIHDDTEKTDRKSSVGSRHSKSPDSLDNLFSKSYENVDELMEKEQVKVATVRPQNPIANTTENFDKFVEPVEIRQSPRRLSSTISKSTETFEKIEKREEPRPAARRFLYPALKYSDPVSKSSDSLEAIESLRVSDDSIERRRSSFEIRPRRNKVMSISSENFEALDKRPELHKRCSASDVHLLRVKRPSQVNDKVISKSTENFDSIRSHFKDAKSDKVSMFEKQNWRLSKKREFESSSDNLQPEDKVDNREARKSPKRVPSASIVDIFPGAESHMEEERRPIPMKKPPRIQKSSESSELGSTDTLDSERRNKSSDSTETLDSLEKDLEHDKKDDDLPDDIVEIRNKNDSWPTQMTDIDHGNQVDDKQSVKDKSFWRQTSDSKENIDIHQLLSITIVNRIDNGNNQRNSVPFPKRKIASTPTSPVVKQEDNKLLMNNLLASKNDEELQNMLNGNISEVSTDTKSFKEKLIMFEKLGK